MAKWATSRSDIIHYASIGHDLIEAAGVGMGVRLELLDGNILQGDVAGWHIQNNGGQGGKWIFSGEITLNVEGVLSRIDYMDIKVGSIRGVANQ